MQHSLETYSEPLETGQRPHSLHRGLLRVVPPQRDKCFCALTRSNAQNLSGTREKPFQMLDFPGLQQRITQQIILYNIYLKDNTHSLPFRVDRQGCLRCLWKMVARARSTIALSKNQYSNHTHIRQQRS